MQQLAFMTRNDWNALMDQEYRALRRAIAKDMLRVPISDMGAVNLRASQQQPFVVQRNVTTPAAGTLDVTIISQAIEKGFAAVITGLAHGIVGPGFTDYSGNLIWEFMVDFRFVPNYAQITQVFGDLQQPRPVMKGIPVGPGEQISYLVTNPVGSPVPAGPPSYTFAAISGVKFPLK